MDHRRFDNEQSMVSLPRPETPSVGYSGMEAEEIHEDGRIIVKDAKNHRDGRRVTGDADYRGCWYSFMAFIRSCWVTRYSENVEDNQELLIKTNFRELVVYAIFLSLLIAICFIPANPLAFYLENNVEQTVLHLECGSPKLTLGSAGSFDDISKCLARPFADMIHQDQWYSGQPFSPQQMHYFNMESKLLGLVRLRQVRMDASGCVVPADFASEIPKCFPIYSIDQESTQSFGLNDSTA
ncbi:Polycystic kidney disease 2-like 1 [Cichlidogyrus casuarinus]|uniref:Polycystic kidney disease 2-like 1 n=1 Tax=Cichlidogyrus casuarinus TaxID=1844966 RepID=A0ABD2QLZ2_9PLAT